ncbi:MAG: glycosyl hydrolase-related protein, partial [Bacillota bacterium]|nr:glycosyl hydrolase-related protein [Bacillota bacterium]
RWGMVFHDGDWQKARIPQMAMQFCNPPIAIIEANHPGRLSQEHSFASMECGSSLLTVLKQAEDNDGLIIRAYEYAGQKDPARIRLARKDIKMDMGCYEIQSIRVNQHPSKTDILETADQL